MTGKACAMRNAGISICLSSIRSEFCSHCRRKFLVANHERMVRHAANIRPAEEIVAKAASFLLTISGVTRGS